MADTNSFKKETDKYIITLSETPYKLDDSDTIYVMFLDDKGEIISEPYIPSVNGKELTINFSKAGTEVLNGREENYIATDYQIGDKETDTVSALAKAVLVDYYVQKTGNSQAMQIDITPDKFGGNYYIEASTLFRTTDGIDMPAEFIIPNGKVQSNFTFTMASSGDPSSFSFVVDAFPDYLRFDHSKKVLAAIQVITDAADEAEERRASTQHPKSS